MKKLIIFLSFVFFASGLWANEDLRDLDLDHWAYPILRRFETKGYLILPATRPYQRWQVMDLLQDLLRTQMDGGIKLSPADQYYFDKISQELHIGLVAKRLVEQDLITVGNGLLNANGDIGLLLTSYSGRQTVPGYKGSGYFDLWGEAGNVFLYDQRLTADIEKENQKIERISGNTQTWRGGKFSSGWSYFRMGKTWINLTAGRQQHWWGPGRYGTLLLSNNAGPFDQVDLRINYNSLAFESFFGVLNTDLQRYLSGHRLTINLPWNFNVGLSEIVLYQANQIDPVYMNPLLPFYATQWNQRDDDNVLWAGDMRWRSGKGVVCYGELLLDDVQYEQDPPAPQKMGFLLGGSWADPMGLSDVDLTVEWAGNQKWVYTHRRYINRYVGSDTINVLGHWIGTDADVFNIVLEHRFHPRLNLGAGYQWLRHGQGSIDQGYFSYDDPQTTFLSGTVSREDKLNVMFKWEPYYWLTADGNFWLAYIKNPENIADTGLNDRGMEISVKVDF